jgi:hypothetical protein
LVKIATGLIFEGHRMLHSTGGVRGSGARARRYCFFNRGGARNEGIHEIAIQSIRTRAQAAERDTVIDLSLFLLRSQGAVRLEPLR